MPRRTPNKTRRRPPAPGTRVQCHVVSNTHWDREWKHSAQRTRFELVQMLDLLLDILDREPAYKSFHLDSQTVPLLDYLAVRPEREAALRRHVRRGRLIIGPWFCLPDEFCVAGESLIRNLLLGHRIARRFGPVSKTGYSPFSWGQISQMPQLYRGFGIDVMMFYRGVNTLVAPRSEFIWRGADGSKLIASRLGARPRYNTWYVLQRPAYWGRPLDRLNEFETTWSQSDGPFRLVTGDLAELEYLQMHPRHRYDDAAIPAAAAQALREQNADWSTPHRLWSLGHDSSHPDAREVRLIADARQALRDTADVFHSTIAAFADGLRRCRRRDWPVVTGEMRHTYTKGSTSALLGWVISARHYLKQDNFRTERLLHNLAEPLAVCAALLGAPYPRAFLDAANQYLLENHCHDSIGGCGRDSVHDDMLYRARQSREISTCVLEHAFRDIAGTIDLSDASAGDMALVVHNPAPQPRHAVVPLVLDIPAEWDRPAFELLDEQGRTVPLQECGPPVRHQERITNPHDVFTYLTARRQHVRAEFRDLPGVGYRTYRVRPANRPPSPAGPALLTGPQTMENEHLAVTVEPNGTLTLLHKPTGRRYEGLGYFRDSGAVDNPWQHRPPARDTACDTRNARATVQVLHAGPLEAAIRTVVDWQLPAGLTEDEQARSPQFVPYPITNTLTLRRGQPWVEIVTTLDNTARDHYLRVCFPTGVRSDAVHVQSQFDIVERPVKLPDPSLFDDEPQTEQPMNSFVDISDGAAGLALLNEGLKAYEAHDDDARTLSLTLLRCFALRLWVPDKKDTEHLSRGAQCPGHHSFRYAVRPHAGNWAAARLWTEAEWFNTPILAAQVGPTRHGTQPRTRSFLELRPAELHVSALKQSADGRGWIVRLFNPLDRAARGRLRLNAGCRGPEPVASPVEHGRAEHTLPPGRGRKWRKVEQVSLEERPLRRLKMSADGWVTVNISRKQILTLAFWR